MHHELSLITTIAASLGLALVMGFLAVRLKMPPLVGYLVAGILIGPHTRGFIADVALASQLAEIGVMLLMFGVGLHFSLEDLEAVRRIAVPGAIVQIIVATALGTATAMFWGWSFGGGLVFGLALSVASTVVLLRALEARGTLESMNGRIAVGWLIVEDLVMVLVLVLLPPLANVLGGQATHGADRGIGMTLLITFAKVGAFVDPDARGRTASLSAHPLAGGQDGLAGAVHVVRHRRCGGRCVRRRGICSACRSRWARSSPA